jgi:hypothetical protein
LFAAARFNVCDKERLISAPLYLLALLESWPRQQKADKICIVGRVKIKICASPTAYNGEQHASAAAAVTQQPRQSPMQTLRLRLIGHHQ